MQHKLTQMSEFGSIKTLTASKTQVSDFGRIKRLQRVKTNVQFWKHEEIYFEEVEMFSIMR